MDSATPSAGVSVERAGPARATPERTRSIGSTLRRAGIMVAGLACLGLAFAILLPLMLLALLVVLVIVGAGLVGSALQRKAIPEDDGRRNVRVREGSTPPTDAVAP